MDWDKLSKKLKADVAKQEYVVYVTNATLPSEHSDATGDYGFTDLDDGTIYINTGNIKKHGKDTQHVLKHEMAHRVLGHMQADKWGSGKPLPLSQALKKIAENLHREVDVNTLLHKTYGFPSTGAFTKELTGWMLSCMEEYNFPFGHALAMFRKEILDRHDVPSKWKTAVTTIREHVADMFAKLYGYDIAYVDEILSNEEPDEYNLEDDALMRHIWHNKMPSRKKDSQPVATKRVMRSIVSPKRKKQANRARTQISALRL